MPLKPMARKKALRHNMRARKLLKRALIHLRREAKIRGKRKAGGA